MARRGTASPCRTATRWNPSSRLPHTRSQQEHCTICMAFHNAICHRVATHSHLRSGPHTVSRCRKAAATSSTRLKQLSTHFLDNRTSSSRHTSQSTKSTWAMCLSQNLARLQAHQCILQQEWYPCQWTTSPCSIASSQISSICNLHSSSGQLTMATLLWPTSTLMSTWPHLNTSNHSSKSLASWLNATLRPCKTCSSNTLMACLCLSKPCSITTTHAVSHQTSSFLNFGILLDSVEASERAKRLLFSVHVIVFPGFSIYTPSACDACRFGFEGFVQYY